MRVNCREQIANPAESVNGQDERRKCAAVDSPARLCCSVIKRATAPPFDKGGKGVGDFRGIVRFWNGW
ncbi:MAG: hypothetical protein ACLR5P_05045 [[Eubacterium] siraeum]